MVCRDESSFFHSSFLTFLLQHSFPSSSPIFIWIYLTVSSSIYSFFIFLFFRYIYHSCPLFLLSWFSSSYAYLHTDNSLPPFPPLPACHLYLPLQLLIFTISFSLILDLFPSSLSLSHFFQLSRHKTILSLFLCIPITIYLSVSLSLVTLLPQMMM